MLAQYLGGIFIAVLFGLFGGWFITTIYHADNNGAWVARRKTFKTSSLFFMLAYVVIHSSMFVWG